MLTLPGLRVSLIGALVFLPSMISLLFLPHAISALGMLIGGAGVWGGFIMTLFHFYRAPASSEPPDA